MFQYTQAPLLQAEQRSPSLDPAMECLDPTKVEVLTLNTFTFWIDLKLLWGHETRENRPGHLRAQTSPGRTHRRTVPLSSPLSGVHIPFNKPGCKHSVNIPAFWVSTFWLQTWCKPAKLCGCRFSSETRAIRVDWSKWSNRFEF